jgi:hypothetical protein
MMNKDGVVDGNKLAEAISTEKPVPVAVPQPKTEQLAVITQPKFGSINNTVGLYFRVYISDTVYSEIFLDVEKTVKMCNDYKLGNVADLHGKPCMVELGKDTVVVSRLIALV